MFLTGLELSLGLAQLLFTSPPDVAEHKWRCKSVFSVLPVVYSVSDNGPPECLSRVVMANIIKVL